MQVVDYPILPPGRCLATGSSEGQMLDLNVDVVHEGRVYFSVGYVNEMIRVMGGITADQVDALVSRAEVAEARVADVERELAEFTLLRRLLGRAIRREQGWGDNWLRALADAVVAGEVADKDVDPQLVHELVRQVGKVLGEVEAVPQ